MLNSSITDLHKSLKDSFVGDLLPRSTVGDWLKWDAVKMPYLAFSRHTKDVKAPILHLDASLLLFSLFCFVRQLAVLFYIPVMPDNPLEFRLNTSTMVGRDLVKLDMKSPLKVSVLTRDYCMVI